MGAHFFIIFYLWCDTLTGLDSPSVLQIALFRFVMCRCMPLFVKFPYIHTHMCGACPRLVYLLGKPHKQLGQLLAAGGWCSMSSSICGFLLLLYLYFFSHFILCVFVCDSVGQRNGVFVAYGSDKFPPDVVKKYI